MMFLGRHVLCSRIDAAIIQIIARALPLFYVNEEATQCHDLTMNQTEALINGGIVLIFAAIFLSQASF